MARISFPLNFKSGRLGISHGHEAAQQALYALLHTYKGELPLSRNYGSTLDYNITLESAYGQMQDLIEQVSTYHPDITLTDATPLLNEDGAVIDWRISAEFSEE